jgi:hypothetical protein
LAVSACAGTASIFVVLNTDSCVIEATISHAGFVPELPCNHAQENNGMNKILAGDCLVIFRLHDQPGLLLFAKCNVDPAERR